MSKSEAFASSIAQYLNYTKMPWGRLFYETAWQQIDRFWTGQGQSILDIGCGFGISSNEYAKRGNKVTGIDLTKSMIEIAQEQGTDAQFINGSFENTDDRLGIYDWVFCHNILEYMEDPKLFINKISGCQKPNGYLSLIAHNPVAKIMKKAIINKDPDSALASMESCKEYSAIIQTDITTFSCEQLSEWLGESGYEMVGRFGIHNLYGYIADNEIKQDEEWHNQMKKLELELGCLSPYREIAIFTHIVATKQI
ncbi:2-polyprenyl-3-methyl-5-hydroxy-6-metoxy-1,4-benzoquinol methylase [Paenibacillus sophorae]|uniref:2-polyprenyl-3-methyl-5-hydroxy-6-metoxy-1,4-benzoquinol methylase n=1 Tax=Paenibacillus sophorae TaxID=1333845 RepID=A0A1H8QVT8_9BACL|nr:class I SAM-dependent methyltransferase [Paenibacillus sophorae]QWU14847.1 methyltransferase domain-containing protein [Paenibacillus sophorae]SEO58081.1 2-polyprenyl-3-methyl-5-hydroxy-6-metoxy-1,4-benzoquinol methylase [Paenibacillus sophorae]